MHLMNLKNTFGALALAGLLGACVDAPSEAFAPAMANNPLAASFDLLADEQFRANDVERGEDLRWAALSLRAGVTPAVLEVTNNGMREVYDAFVHAVTWATLTQALRPPLHRSLVAWRRSGDVMQVLLIGTVKDSAPVLNPLSLRPTTTGELTSAIAGAKAAYFERGPVSSTWMGVGGVAKVAENPPQQTACEPNDGAKPPGVSCQLTKFGVALTVEFARTQTRDSREVDVLSPKRSLIARPQVVAGVKMVFTCEMPLSTGCR